MDEVVSSDLLPWAIRDIPGEHRLSRGRGLVLDADCALADIVSYVSIYDGQIPCLPHLGLLPIDTLMCSMKISKAVIKELWVNTDSCPFEKKARIDRQFIPGTPEMSGNVGNFLLALGPSSKDEAIGGVIH